MCGGTSEWCEDDLWVVCVSVYVCVSVAAHLYGEVEGRGSVGEDEIDVGTL